MKLEFSFDDYCKENDRLALLLKKYDLESFTTFYIDFRDSIESGKQIRRLSAMDFEIGSHTISHPTDLKQIDDELLYAEVQNSKDMIENIIGKECEKFCYPRGRRNNHVIHQVIEAGYLEARTTEVLATSLKDVDIFQKPTTVHVYDRKEYGQLTWEVMAYGNFNKLIDGEIDYFHLWGHSWEIDKLSYWREFEEFIEYVSQKVIEL